MTAIVWFRRDLRLADNPALLAAINSGESVLPIYIHAPQEEGQGAPGAASRWWLHHSLKSLDEQLRRLGSQLQVFNGNSLSVLRELIAHAGASSVYWNRVYEPAFVQRDADIKQALRVEGIEVASHNAALCAEPWQVMTQAEQPYRVFTPFWRNAKAHLYTHQPSDAPTHIPAVNVVSNAVDVDHLKLLPQIGWDVGLRATWKPGEVCAWSMLREFLDVASDYGDQRNRPDRRGTSMLSPHLHFGEISPRQIVAAMHAFAAGRHVEDLFEPYLRELGWREFAHHLIYHFPHTVRTNLNPRFDQFPWAEPSADKLHAWQQGRTGIPIVDAGMRELWQTGWMHNRVRMIVASFLTKNLRYHWRHGADWFFDTLVDADLAANSMGWQWAAGTGADAAPYFRVFNPILQGERFDPDGHYVRRYIPELAKVPNTFIHKPWQLPRAQQAGFGVQGVYATPILDLAATRNAALTAYATIKSAN